MWQKYAWLFRHVIVSFDYPDHHRSSLCQLCRDFHDIGQAMKPIEDKAVRESRIYAGGLHLKDKMAGRMNLRSLALDFSKAFCPMGYGRAFTTDATFHCKLFLEWRKWRIALGPLSSPPIFKTTTSGPGLTDILARSSTSYV